VNKAYSLLILLLIPFFLPYSSQSYSFENVITNLDTPWSLIFTNDNRMIFTERQGYVKSLINGKLFNLSVQNLEAKEIGEGGLLGITLDPDFDKNNYVYLYYTYVEKSNIWNRVVRYTLVNNSLIEPKILIDKIPGNTIHNGGRIKFGPDGKLYITTGDAFQRNLAQDLNSLAGKILRINPDGSIPNDNPFPDSPIFSYGHRNPQGIDWGYGNIMYESEHGPSGEQGYAHDEINLIEKGKNYGWPIVVGKANDQRFVDPIIESGLDTWAPSGILFYKGDKYPDLKGKLLVACLRGQQILVIEIDKNDPHKVLNYYSILKNSLGRIRDVVVDKEGYIYILTSNKDGRGNPSSIDDRIVKLIYIPSNNENFFSFYNLLGIIGSSAVIIVLISILIFKKFRKRKTKNVQL